MLSDIHQKYFAIIQNHVEAMINEPIFDQKQKPKTMGADSLDNELERAASLLGLELDRGGDALTNRAEFTDTCLLIRQDNLVALKTLLSANVRTEFCYIDPPYNTGNNFIYHDNRKGKSDSLWGSHKPWMEFMLPRLVYARQVLSDNGILAISIDDHAYSHLKILLDVVFGEECCLGTLIVMRSKNGLGSNKHVADMHEYVVLYGRSETAEILGVPESDDRAYPRQDERGQYTLDGLFRKKGDASLREDRPNMYYPLYVSECGEVFTERSRPKLKEVFPRDSKGIERRWLWGKDKATAESWRLFASPGGVVYVKNYQSPNKRVMLRSLLAKPEYLTDAATREIKGVFGEKLFDTPKPIALIQLLIDACSLPNATILDFFAGSGTTGEAVAALNQQEATGRRVVLVEHESPIPARHAANGAGFVTTADLTEFRLKRAVEAYPGFTYSVLR